MGSVTRLKRKSSTFFRAPSCAFFCSRKIPRTPPRRILLELKDAGLENRAPSLQGTGREFKNALGAGNFDAVDLLLEAAG